MNALCGDANLYRAAINSMDEVVVIHDLAQDACVVFANQTACQHFGVDLPTLRTWHPADWDLQFTIHQRMVQNTAAEEQAHRYETLHRVASGKQVPMDVTLSRLVLSDGDYLLSRSRPRFSYNSNPWLERGIQSICLECSQQSSYDTASERRLMIERYQRQSQETVRAEIFDLLSMGVGLRRLLTRVVAFAEASCPDLVSAILLPDRENTHFHQCIAPSLPNVFTTALEGVEITETSGVFGSAACLKKTVTLTTLQYQGAGLNILHALGLNSGSVTPILDSHGVLLGVFAFFHRTIEPLNESALGHMEQACQMAQLVINHHHTEAHIHYQANYDSLTGLPNRALLNARVAEWMSDDKRLLLLYIDIDNFKEINDTFGHYQGDQMLVLLARRLRSLIPPDDLVARMSGDEFIAVLSEPEQAETFVETLRMALVGNYDIGPNSVWVSVSIGVSIYPEQAQDMNELLSNADQALFAAKEAGRNCLRLFDEVMRDKIQLRVRLSSDLRAALSAGQLAVFYQPIIDLESGQVVKAEALLRWQHPELGPVSPDVFIPLAEEVGVIHEIGNWVFRQAARVSMQWNQLESNTGAVLRRISVNRSPRQFFTRDGSDDWISCLREMGVPGAAMGVEITEGLLLDDRPDVMRQLTAFRQAGIAISLDDFGTGYSSLSYLTKFEIDYLKIDRSFVKDIVSREGSRAIVESISTMAARLDMQVIAEGVEEQAQAQVLAGIGCRMAQGYLYAQPMSEPAFMTYVNTNCCEED